MSFSKTLDNADNKLMGLKLDNDEIFAFLLIAITLVRFHALGNLLVNMIELKRCANIGNA